MKLNFRAEEIVGLVCFTAGIVISLFVASPANIASAIWICVGIAWLLMSRSNRIEKQKIIDIYINDNEYLKKRVEELNQANSSLISNMDRYARENKDLKERLEELEEAGKDIAEKYDAAVHTTRVAAQKIDELSRGVKTGPWEYTEQDRIRIKNELRDAGLE